MDQDGRKQGITTDYKNAGLLWCMQLCNPSSKKAGPGRSAQGHPQLRSKLPVRQPCRETGLRKKAAALGWVGMTLVLRIYGGRVRWGGGGHRHPLSP